MQLNMTAEMNKMERFGENKEFNRFREGMRNYFNFRKEAPVQAFISECVKEFL